MSASRFGEVPAVPPGPQPAPEGFTVEGLDVPDKPIILLRVNLAADSSVELEPLYETSRTIADEISKIRPGACVFVVFGDNTLEAFDEQVMNAAGWFRRG